MKDPYLTRLTNLEQVKVMFLQFIKILLKNDTSSQMADNVMNPTSMHQLGIQMQGKVQGYDTQKRGLESQS